MFLHKQFSKECDKLGGMINIQPPYHSRVFRSVFASSYYWKDRLWDAEGWSGKDQVRKLTELLGAIRQ
jgi:hypothetical protein